MPASPSPSPLLSAVADRLSGFARGDDRVGSLLALCVGRVLVNAARRGEDWRALARDRDIAHVADWLKAAVVSGSPWLGNADGQGRPKKLLKFPTLAAIVAEADRDMLRAARHGTAARVVAGDEAEHADLGGGYRLVRLLTPAALDRESAAMQHCIGNGAYDGHLSSDVHLFLSLRDGHGKAHATLEVEDGRLIQLQGKQNRPPVRRYADVLAPFVCKAGWEVDVPASHLGYVVDAGGAWHDIDRLPEGLTVGGGLYLYGTSVTSLPEGLKVGGSLDLSGTSITTLPEGLKVGGSLDLRRTPITSLPEGLAVGGDLYLSGTSVTTLPEGLKVGGSLDLSGTSITILPDSIADDTVVYVDSGWMRAADFRVACESRRGHGTF